MNLVYRSKNNYLKADITLGLVSIGFFLSYPFHTSFAGGLISSGCSAGMIGGLADWFAVNALFRKPLGIQPSKIIRTEIIPRNRERIFDALVEMVQNELLHKENLKIKLNQYNLSEILIEYLTVHGGQRGLEELLITLTQDIVKIIDPLVLKNMLDRLLEEGINSFKLAPLLAKTIKISLRNDYLEPLLDFLFDVLKVLLNHPQMNQVLIILIQQAYDFYEGDNSARKLVSSFLPSSVVMAGIVQEKLLSSLSDPATHTQFKGYLERFCVELETNPSLQEKVERAKDKLIQNFNIQELILKYLSDTAKSLQEKNPVLELWVNKLLDRAIISFKNKNSLRMNFDNLIKTKLTDWIDKKHDKIGNIVRDSLNELSNAMLIKLIENKAGNDLQMIRINGSLVGGIAGMLIFLITYLIS
ncbi:MAG: DUF445 domain-containing protein [Desulfitobacteriaceae bacterium]